MKWNCLQSTEKKKRRKKKKIYPENNYKNVTTEEFISECISCHNCKGIFNLASNQIKIHCAGCDKFFHCGIAGKCIGKNCNSDTSIGTNHKLSWCVNCVPSIPFNKEKIDGDGYCLCNICFNSH